MSDNSPSPESMNAPDVAGAFQSELAALFSYFAERILAAQLGLAPSAIIKLIIQERTVAARSLMDRWHIAEQKKGAERPTRPAVSDADKTRPSLER